MPDRYIANIKLERVVVPSVSGSARYNTEAEQKRSIEGTTVIVRSNTFEGLKKKVQAHLALIDDEDFGDERTHRGG